MTRTRHRNPYQAQAVALPTTDAVEIAAFVDYYGDTLAFPATVDDVNAGPVNHLEWLPVEDATGGTHVTATIAGQPHRLDRDQPIVLRPARTPAVL